MYWILSQVVKDDRLNCDDFGACPANTISAGYEQALNAINRASLPTALLGRLTYDINRGKDSPEGKIENFLPYPDVWAKKVEGGRKLRISDRTKSYLKRNFAKLPIIAQAALDEFKSIL